MRKIFFHWTLRAIQGRYRSQMITKPKKHLNIHSKEYFLWFWCLKKVRTEVGRGVGGVGVGQSHGHVPNKFDGRVASLHKLWRKYTFPSMQSFNNIGMEHDKPSIFNGRHVVLHNLWGKVNVSFMQRLHLCIMIFCARVAPLHEWNIYNFP